MSEWMTWETKSKRLTWKKFAFLFLTTRKGYLAKQRSQGIF